MTESLLSISKDAVTQVVNEIRAFGRNALETGGFLLAPRDVPWVTVVAFAGARGIVRRRDLFEISERALDRLFVFADESELWAPIQFHSHRLGKFLSRTDREHGLRSEGFVSVVVPKYDDPPTSMEAWGWWRFRSGAWTTSPSCAVAEAAIRIIEFDEAGVRDR